MAYNHHRANIRNYLVGLTLQEARIFLSGLVAADDAKGAGYAAEFVLEFEAETTDYYNCDLDGNCAGDADCRREHGCEG
jgi:hypothetical protein